MFLYGLQEEEKQNLLELVSAIAQSDGTYAQEEQEVVDAYRRELGIEEFEKSGMEMYALIDYFSERTQLSQRIVFYEVYGMIMVDSVLAKEEEDILNYIKQKFSLSAVTMETIMEAVDNLYQAYHKAYLSIFE